MKRQSPQQQEQEQKEGERTDETIVLLFEKDGTYVADAAAGELVIVQLVP